MQLVLSLFPGIDLLGRAFEEVWGSDICVVRGPDVIFGGDIRGWHVPPGKFDGVIGGPPCTWWSTASNIAKARGQKVGPDLIPDFIRCVRECHPRWFVMENVQRAPVPQVPGYTVWSRMVNDLWFGGIQGRKRRISFDVLGEGKRPLLMEPVVFLHQKPVGVVTTTEMGYALPK